MLTPRKSQDRGYFDHGWLKSYHSFSFADYHDPEHMHFGPLRVINEDFIKGGEGFPTHGHRDMEIITYPISGAIEHKDSTGSSGVIYPYEVQKMTAGKGILHSEFNHLKDKDTHLLQIWVLPRQKGLGPSYEQKDFRNQIESGKPILLVSPTGAHDSLHIHQDLHLWAKQSRNGEAWEPSIKSDRLYWIQIVRGKLRAGNILLEAGDGLSIQDEKKLEIESIENSELLFFDMAKI